MSWRKVKLGELIENFSVRAKDVGGAEGLDFFGVSNETGITTTKYAAEEKAEDYKIIEKGCFAYNPYRINVGSIGLMTDDTKGLISPAYVVFKPKPKSIQSELLLKFLKSNEGLRQIKLYARGTVRQALRFEDLCNIELSLPDYETQNQLLQKLNKTQNCAEEVLIEQSYQLDLIKQLRQQILKDAMQGKLVPQNLKDEPAAKLLDKLRIEKEKLGKKNKPLPKIKPEEIPFKIPENWVWCRLGETGELKRGKSKHRPRNDKRLFENGKYPFIQTGDVSNAKFNKDLITTTNNFYSEFGLNQSEVQAKGTLCITIAANIAECGFLNFDACVPDSIVCFSSIDRLTEKYVYYFIKTAKEELERYAPATAQKNINLGILNSLPIPFPPLSEQKRIVTKIEELMNLCDELEASVEINQEYTDLLYQTALKEALQPKTIKETQKDLAVAAEPQVEYVKGKVVELKPTNVDYYKRTLLAAEIVWQLHKEPTLGHLKLQKLIYLCQKTADMQLPTNFLRQAMGPYDNRLMRSIDKQLKEKKWFEYQKDQVFKYQPLEKAGQHHNDFLQYFSEESESIQFIIDKFKTIKSDIVEIVGTLYACMDNMLNEKVIFSEALLIQRFYEWSEEKKKFSEDQIKRVFSRMKDTGIIPK